MEGGGEGQYQRPQGHIGAAGAQRGQQHRDREADARPPTAGAISAFPATAPTRSTIMVFNLHSVSWRLPTRSCQNYRPWSGRAEGAPFALASATGCRPSASLAAPVRSERVHGTTRRFSDTPKSCRRLKAKRGRISRIMLHSCRSQELRPHHPGHPQGQPERRQLRGASSHHFRLARPFPHRPPSASAGAGLQRRSPGDGARPIVFHSSGASRRA